MRRAFLLPLGALLAVASASAAPAAAPDAAGADDLSAAERRILEACLAEPGTNPAACGCYVRALRELLPAADHALATRLAAAAMRGDGEAFRRIVSEHALTPERLQDILVATDRALKRAEHRCENATGDDAPPATPPRPDR